jgi:hypothetical protein
MESDESRLHAEADRERFAMRRKEADAEREERDLERKLKDFEAREDDTKKRIEDEWRREHFGHDPDRPPAWREKPEGS